MVFLFQDVRHALINCKERLEVMRKLATLLNSFTPPDLRVACIGAWCVCAKDWVLAAAW